LRHSVRRNNRRPHQLPGPDFDMCLWTRALALVFGCLSFHIVMVVKPPELVSSWALGLGLGFTTDADSPRRLAPPALAHTSSLVWPHTRRARAPTSLRNIGFCAIWAFISSSSSSGSLGSTRLPQEDRCISKAAGLFSWRFREVIVLLVRAECFSEVAFSEKSFFTPKSGVFCSPQYVFEKIRGEWHRTHVPIAMYPKAPGVDH
jgi:hypothetical protein